LILLGITVFGGGLVTNGWVLADSMTPPTISSSSTTTATTNKARVQNIISKGDEEISRRLATLITLTSKVNSASKLTASDKTTLSNEVASTISGLTALKTKLDSETTLPAASSDAQSIYTEYRVYALVAPKVELIKVADDQQAVQSKLSSLAASLQSRISAEQTAGKNVATLQSELSDMTSKTAAASAISSNIESSVVNLEPTDYNSNHALLSGDNTQLKTAASDDLAAYSDAKSIVSALS
jgi:hypothetical protein